MNMKKVLLFALVLMLAAPMSAQWSVGGKIGLNTSSVNYPDDIENPSHCFGINGGFLTQYRFNRFFSLQAELLYMKQGYKEKDLIWINLGDDPMDMDIALHYLEIPLLAKFTHKTGLNLQFGPQIGFQLKRRLRVGEVVQQQKLMMGEKQPFDFSLAFGAGYEFKNGFLLDFRYLLGLTSAYKNVEGFQNRTFYFSLGYKFDL